MFPPHLEELAFETGIALAKAIWNSNVTAPMLVERDGWPEPLGTGSYLRCNGANYLLTAEHVAARGKGGVIQHLPVPDGRFRPCDGPFMTEPWPFEVAIARASSQTDAPEARGRAVSQSASDTYDCL